jgi:hypothetical protein
MQHRASARRLDGHADHKAQTAEAGADIKASLREGYSKEVWGKLQVWYKRAGDQPQKLSRQDIHAAVTEEYCALYTKDPPPLV